MELKNQPIYKGVHKTLCINFRAYAAFFLRFVTNLGEAALKGMLYLGFVFYVTFWFII